MRALVLHPSPEAGRTLARALENLHEQWQADWYTRPEGMLAQLSCQETSLLLLAGNIAVLDALLAAPPRSRPLGRAAGHGA